MHNAGVIDETIIEAISSTKGEAEIINENPDFDHKYFQPVPSL